MALSVNEVLEAYRDGDYWPHFDQQQAVLTRKAVAFVAMIATLVSLIALATSIPDSYGLVPESLAVGLSSTLFAFLARRVPFHHAQKFFTLGMILVYATAELTSAVVNGPVHLDRPIHTGLINIFFVLACGGLRLRYALWTSFVCSVVFVLGIIAVGKKLDMIPEVFGILLLANAFGHLVNSWSYIEGWRRFRANMELVAQRSRLDEILANILPSEVSDELKVTREKPVFYERSKVSVLVMDLVGYSDWVQKCDDKTVISTLNDLFARFDAVLSSNGATKIKTMGDAYIAVTGLSAGDRVEARCVNTASQLASEIDAFNQSHHTQFKSRVGIATGPAIFGVIGRNRPKFDIWGATFTRAQELEKTCSVGGMARCDITELGMTGRRN